MAHKYDTILRDGDNYYTTGFDTRDEAEAHGRDFSDRFVYVGIAQRANAAELRRVSALNSLAATLAGLPAVKEQSTKGFGHVEMVDPVHGMPCLDETCNCNQRPSPERKSQ